jgi:hypothetical protein
MSYVDNTTSTFDSGGKFEAKVDSLPTVAESLLYSVNYSENPLEFSIDITNVDEVIPFEQMAEIKEWLFAQSGWQKLRLESSDYRDYYLMCLLIPEEDIADGSGYRGLRCTVKNISGFWYRDEHTQVYTVSDMFGHTTGSGNYRIPIEVHTDPSMPIYPIIECRLAPLGAETDTPSSTDTRPMSFWIRNTTNSTMLATVIPSSSLTNFSNNNVMIDSQFPFFYKGDKTNFVMSYVPKIEHISSRLLCLENGINNIQVACHLEGITTRRYYSYFQIHYTTKTRIGGF